ncbi:MAG TPA: hypothetical protein V6C72_00395 [Chroococcales cyanobacterium]
MPENNKVNSQRWLPSDGSDKSSGLRARDRKRHRFLAAFSLLTLATSNLGCLSPASAERSSNYAGDTEIAPGNELPAESGKRSAEPSYIKGGVTYTVPKGTAFKLKLASVPTNGMRLLDRDLEGNLLPAKLGQEITAKTTEDLFVDNNKVIPEGTIFHGYVSHINPQRHMARPTSLDIQFDELTTPDGRTFAFKAAANNDKESTGKTKLKGFGRLAAHAGGGAIVGALVAYQLFGLHNTIACHGYNIAGGAAGGALLATAFAIYAKGPKASLEPGDDLNMEINTDLLMPIATEPTKKVQVANLPGLEIQINKSKVVSDGFTGHILKLDCQIFNNSTRNLRSIDLFVEDSNGNRYPLCPGDEDENELVFSVGPHTQKHVNLFFQLEYPKLKRQLVWLNRNNRQVCFRENLPK